MENVVILPLGRRSAASAAEPAAVNDAAYLHTNDSALCALTDFRHENPITVQASSFVDDALRDMHRQGVHALLVTREQDTGTSRQVLGMVTNFEIERSRPRRYPQGTFSTRLSRLRVAEIMTPCSDLSPVKYQSLQSLTVSELYENFQGTGLTHLLVIEHHGDGSTLARGLVSRAFLTMRLHRARVAWRC